MRSDSQLMLDAFEAYMIGIKGVEHFISEPSQRYHLSFEQYLILRDIVANPGIKMMHLADKIDVSRSAVSRQLKVLIDSSYIQQRRDPSDRRAQYLSATKTGQETAKKITDAMFTRFSRWLDLYGRERGGQLIDSITEFGRQIVKGGAGKQDPEGVSDD